MTSPSSPLLRIGAPLLAGAVVLLLTVLGDRLVGNPPGWGPAQWAGSGVAVLVAASGLLLRRGALARAATGLCLGFLGVVALVSLVEVGFRVSGHDFAREEEQYRAIPTYFQKPIEPTGEVFFRRPGPQHYEGQVLNTRLSQLHIVPNPFADERVVSVDYDRYGFRNPPDLEDWVIAVTGDSFTELGYLLDAELHTSILADELGVPVKNLGVSQTGNLAQVSYLRDYGVAPSTRHFVILWYEGNDPLETLMESRDLQRFEETGERPSREFEVQSSLVREVYRALVDPRNTGEHDLTHALFPTPAGNVPVTVSFAPRDLDDVPAELVEPTKAALNLAFERYASLAAEHGITPWLAYVPCKLRVHREGLLFDERTPQRIRSWEPTPLPDRIRRMCEAHGIRFHDLTPALREEAQRTGELLFNTMYDTHINAHGARVVGGGLARLLGPEIRGAGGG